MIKKRQNVDHVKNINKKFNRLLILDVFSKGKYRYYKALCDCGIIIETTTYGVLNESTKSCGCYHKEKVSESKKYKSKLIKPKGESGFNYLFLTYKRNAKLRNKDFNLSKEDFRALTKQNCYYCDINPQQQSKYYGKKDSEPYIYNGVDRLDNNIGYELYNCVACCKICNRAKGNLESHEFYLWTRRISVHFGKK